MRWEVSQPANKIASKKKLIVVVIDPRTYCTVLVRRSEGDKRKERSTTTTIMSVSSYTAAKIQKLLHNSRAIKRGAELVRQEIFGHVPQLNIRRGTKTAKKGFTGPYLARYYPQSINTVARKIFPGWETEQEEYRRMKLIQMRRKGKGPPKKGAGARSKKK